MWTDDQVKSLNEYQVCGYYHQFTCGHGHDLVANNDGWYCPECPDYKQDWCHAWMANWEWKKLYELD